MSSPPRFAPSCTDRGLQSKWRRANWPSLPWVPSVSCMDVCRRGRRVLELRPLAKEAEQQTS